MQVQKDNIDIINFGAIQEYKKENDGKDASTQKRVLFMNYVIELFNQDLIIPKKEEILIIKYLIYVHKELMTPRVLKFLISNAFKNGGIEELNQLINDLVLFCDDKAYIKHLSLYKKWIEINYKSKKEKLVLPEYFDANEESEDCTKKPEKKVEIPKESETPDGH